ncbi:MAG: threonine ammonia-lyase IlvA [Candidatus Levyibacteriota bacterium]
MKDQQKLTDQVEDAALRITKLIRETPLQYSPRLSQKYHAHIYIKREDLQEVRSFKIRGAYNKISSLNEAEKKRGIVCASAGNHAQGVARSCIELKIKGAIFMPRITPTQKIEKVKQFGGEYVTVYLIGETFDDAYAASVEYGKKEKAIYVHPFDDLDVIAGQGTVGKEIYLQLEHKADVVVVPIGGGGMISGVGSYLKNKNPYITIVGCEPQGAASMKKALHKGEVTKLEKIDPFVDGAAVMKVGGLTYEICTSIIDDIVVVPEGKVCSTMIELYQNDGIIAEPAGALSIAALDDIAKTIKNKTVVCILSGGNNDILRYPDIMERSLVYQGLKHYFVIQFTQKPGQLRSFLSNALGPNDDIVLFEYMKKTNREKGPALVGIELKKKTDLKPLLEKMDKMQLRYRKIESEDILYNLLV